MPLNQHYQSMQPWTCEAGCGYVCHVVSVETSPLFLKVRYRCPTCRAEMTRYYDLQKNGYVEALGIQCERSRNAEQFVECRPCAFQRECPLKVAARFSRRGLEVEE